MIALKSSILLFLIFLSIGCKETCYTCTTNCISFVDYPTYYCNSNPDDLEFDSFIDSMSSIYEINEEFLNPSSFCDDNDKFNMLESLGWECKEN